MKPLKNGEMKRKLAKDRPHLLSHSGRSFVVPFQISVCNQSYHKKKKGAAIPAPFLLFPKFAHQLWLTAQADSVGTSRKSQCLSGFAGSVERKNSAVDYYFKFDV